MRKIRNASWETWNKFPGSRYAHEKVVQFCLRNFPAMDKRLLALDLGCGRGVHTEFLAQQRFCVCACDAARNAVAVTRQRISDGNLEASVYRSSIENDYARGKRFDLVLCIGVLDAAGPTAARKCLSRLKQCLSKNGLGLFVFAAEGDSVRTKQAQFAIHAYTKTEVEKLFRPLFPDCWIDRYETTYQNESFKQSDWIVTVGRSRN